MYLDCFNLLFFLAAARRVRQTQKQIKPPEKGRISLQRSRGKLGDALKYQIG
jgi:hypothetical protein